MGDDSLMVSPTEATLDEQMGESQTSSNTVVPVEFEAASAPAAAEAEAVAETSTATITPPSTVPSGPPPRVTSVVPATFVPLDTDLTEPVDAPRDRVERAEAMLQNLDFYRTGVRRGILHLAGLDRQRILLAAAAAAPEGPTGATAGATADPTAADATVDTDDIISPNEIDAMVDSMRTPAVPGLDYNVTAVQMAQQMPLRFPPVGERPGGRRDTVRQLNEVVEKALTQLAGYEGHIGAIQQRWTDALERERRLLDVQFGALPAEGGGKQGDEPAQASEDVAMAGT